jgi:agmatine/peptidylarginine deiminase
VHKRTGKKPDCNFNGGGEKQGFEKDALVAARLTKSSGANIHETEIVLEGGSIEVDGTGTAIRHPR